jgi:hypothetical protein
VFAQVPGDAAFITFGVALTGLGRVELRGATWTAPDNTTRREEFG